MMEPQDGDSANVLVTGGAGYIGSHTCKALAAAGYRPISYDNLVNGHAWSVRWGPFEHGDILDRSRLDEVIAKYRPVAIVHFAAFAYVRESILNPGKYYRNNVQGSLTLLEAATHHGIRNIVYSSSCAIFGTPSKVPITENMTKEPINPYGMSKLMVENMLRDFQRSHALNWIALRYFNAAGCDPDGEIGELHDPETHLIPLALEVAARGRGNLNIFGADYGTPDGTCIRDYVHVTDLADAHVRALKSLQSGTASGPFNLGLGKGFSVREVIQTVREVTNSDVPFSIEARKDGEPAVLVSDSTRAIQMLGWKPSMPDLADIVRTAWNWRKSSRYAQQCSLG